MLVCPQGDGTVVPVMTVTAGTLSASAAAPVMVPVSDGTKSRQYAFSLQNDQGVVDGKVYWLPLTVGSAPNSVIVSAK